MSIQIPSTALVLFMTTALACDSKPQEPEVATAASAPKAASANAPEGDSLSSVVDAYDEVRSALAKDDFTAAVAQAAALRDAAKAATLEEVSDKASVLTERSADDAEAVRATFGEVSKALIAVLAGREKLRGSLHVFECPMAKGYGKWVQREKEKANPYMGQSMLQCGSESSWDA